MCTFANQIKTIKEFKYEKNASINVLKMYENRCKQTEINLSMLWVLQVIESIPYLVQSIGH